MTLLPSLDLFADDNGRPGTFGCRVEIAATMAEALKIAATKGVTRNVITERMAFHLGEKLNPATLNGYTALSHTEKAEHPRDISLMRAMAFDAAIGSDVLISLYARKLGDRQVITTEEAAYIELGKIHQQEKALADRKRALQTLLKSGMKP